MNENNQAIPIKSDLNVKNLKVGSHVFTVDFGYNVDEKDESKSGFGFSIHEFEISKIVNDHIKNEISYYEIFDVSNPKVTLKTNLEDGFFTSEKCAAAELVASLKIIYTKAQEKFNELFS